MGDELPGRRRTARLSGVHPIPGLSPWAPHGCGHACGHTQEDGSEVLLPGQWLSGFLLHHKPVSCFVLRSHTGTVLPEPGGWTQRFISFHVSAAPRLWSKLALNSSPQRLEALISQPTVGLETSPLQSVDPSTVGFPSVLPPDCLASLLVSWTLPYPGLYLCASLHPSSLIS